jgi:hypothetical protein
MRIGALPAPLGCSFRDLEQAWRAAEEVGFHTLWAFDHATPTPDRTPAWEASSLLVAMAARTATIPIGILVFDVFLRHPFVLAGSIAVAQSVSNGRIRVGLGSGICSVSWITKHAVLPSHRLQKEFVSLKHAVVQCLLYGGVRRSVKKPSGCGALHSDH